MINIEEKLFHGIELANYVDYIFIYDITDLDVFEYILKSGKILTREHLYQQKPPNLDYLNSHHFQEKNEVCVSLHPNNRKYEIIEDGTEDAFYDFIMNNISFILKENLICDRSYSLSGIPREIRIKDSILLSDYIEGIGYCDRITRVTEKINKLIEQKKYKELRNLLFCNIYNEFLRTTDIKEVVKTQYQTYNKIKQLLKEYGYDLKIFDPFTGIEHDSIENNLIKAEKTKVKVNEIKEKIRSC